MVSSNGKSNGQMIGALTDHFARAQAEYRGTAINRYRMAEKTRFDSHEAYTTGQAGDHHYASELDYFLMVERARGLDRDDIIAGALVTRLINNVLQKGFTSDPKTGNDLVDEHIKLRWNDFCSDPEECDIQGQHTFHRLAEMVFRDVVVPGDVLVLPTKRGKIQVIESHRVKTPTGLPEQQRDMTVHGVELDGSRRRVAYWITKDDIALHKFPRQDQANRIPAYNDKTGMRQMLHIYHPKRTTQTRGVSKFAPITAEAAMHGDIQFSKLVQQQGVSVWLMIIQRMLGFELPQGVTEDVAWEPDPTSPGQLRPLQKLAAGMVYKGHPGEEIKGFSPNVPNPTFFDHARQIQQLISINMDVPLVVLLLDASETNFSGWRGALEQAKIPFRNLQCWFASQFHQPLYLWKLRQWSTPGTPLSDPLLVAARESGINIFANEWIYPTWVSTEPLKDATAQLLRGRNAMASWRRIQSENGIDWDSESTDIVADNVKLIRKAKRAAAELNLEFPEDPNPVTWMQCASLPTPDGITMNWTTQDALETDRELVTAGGNGND